MIKSKSQGLKIASKVLFIILLLSILQQIIAVWQTRYQLESPLISESVIWEINKHFILNTFIIAIISIICVVFYFYKKFLWIIILVVIALVSVKLNLSSLFFE